MHVKQIANIQNLVDVLLYFSLITNIKQISEEEKQVRSFFSLEESPNARRKRNYQQSEADRWLKQAQHDLESSYNDMHSSTGKVAYDWACYKCYRVRIFFQDRIQIVQHRFSLDLCVSHLQL